jgi:hypothetical protein
MNLAEVTSNMPSPPPLPSKQVVVYNCLSGDVHHLGRQPLSFGATSQCDIQLGSLGFKGGRMQLSRSGKQLQLTVEQGNHHLEVNGSPFDGGLIPYQEEFSLVIDKLAFFFIRTGEGAPEWGEQLKKTPAKSWQLRIIEGGAQRFNDWKKKNCPANYPGSHVLEERSLRELFDEVGKRNWDHQTGVVYHDRAKAGFFAHQFLSLAKPDQIPDAGENRCPRCWMRFETGRILAIHPGDYGDEVLGERELKRFLPAKFDSNGVPLTPEGQPCTRLACPHCRGELPPNFLEKPPHMLSIVGDSMAGKSYFLTVAVNRLQTVLRRNLKVSFTDGDPKGNEALSRMVSRLFCPTDNPEDTFLEKTQFAGSTYKTFRRYGKLVKLPAPFTYNLTSQGRGSASVVFYDNAGDHFRPGWSDTEKSNSSEHIAWASGIIFLFDPLQHRNLLRILDPTLDPQIPIMKKAASKLRLDQEVVLAEMGERLRCWKQTTFGQAHDVPFALVLGKHDLLGDLHPIDRLVRDVCPDGSLSATAIDANSRITQEFLLEYCPDIIAAAEAISSNLKYFPASSFGSPATVFKTGDAKELDVIGPNPSLMKPYLVEAPFLWLLSEFEPNLIQKI